MAASDTHVATAAGDAAFSVSQAVFSPAFVNWAARAAADACKVGEKQSSRPEREALASAFFTEVGRDANDLYRAPSQEVLFAPLWRQNDQHWAITNWIALRRHLLATREDWSAWIEWYERRLAGNFADATLEVSHFLDIEEELWTLGPWAVNQQLLALREEFRSQPNSAESKPIQRPSTYRFVVREGVVEAEPSTRPHHDARSPTRCMRRSRKACRNSLSAQVNQTAALLVLRTRARETCDHCSIKILGG